MKFELKVRVWKRTDFVFKSVLLLLNMEPNLTEFEQEPVQRPTLLTVLCILTFIGSTWAIITSAYSYSTASKTVKAFSEVNIKRQNDSLENSNTGERRKNPSQVE